jgi:hypothetical protein
MNYVRSFRGIHIGCIALLSGSVVSSTFASDVSLYAVYKRQVYVQTNDAAPALRCCPYVFNAVVAQTASNSVSAAAVAASNGTQTPLTSSEEKEFLPLSWVASACETYPDGDAFDANWIAGDYTFLIFGAHDSPATAVLNLAGESYPSQPPRISNFADTQVIDVSRDFTVRWDPFADGTTNDLIFMSVRSLPDHLPVFSTAFLEDGKSLDGTANSTIIPAGTLSPDTEYEIYVRFDKVAQRNEVGYPGVKGLASYASGTRCPIKTAAAPGRS